MGVIIEVLTQFIFGLLIASVLLGLGVMGFMDRGLPLSKHKRLTGNLGKCIGAICLLLALLSVIDAFSAFSRLRPSPDETQSPTSESTGMAPPQYSPASAPNSADTSMSPPVYPAPQYFLPSSSNNGSSDTMPGLRPYSSFVPPSDTTTGSGGVAGLPPYSSGSGGIAGLPPYSSFPDTNAPKIYAKDGTYLGELSSNHYNTDSVSNPYGEYGSRYSNTSINNPYSQYGSHYSDESTSNPYATNAPKIYANDGTYLGKLSSNHYDSDSVSNPYGQYGSPYSSTSINNPYSQYGSH